jgi:hypothetical protein
MQSIPDAFWIGEPRLALTALKSLRRLSYAQVEEALAGKEQSEIAAMLRHARDLAHLLIQRRRVQGTLALYNLTIGWATTEEGRLELLKRHRVEFNILTCVHAANVQHPLDVYRFLRDDAGAQYIQFIPIVERLHPLHFQRVRRSARARSLGRIMDAF